MCSVTNFLKAWVRDYMDHDTLDPILLQRIREFALNTMEEKGQSLQICKSVDERVRLPLSHAFPLRPVC